MESDTILLCDLCGKKVNHNNNEEDPMSIVDIDPTISSCGNDHNKMTKSYQIKYYENHLLLQQKNSLQNLQKSTKNLSFKNSSVSNMLSRVDPGTENSLLQKIKLSLSSDNVSNINNISNEIKPFILCPLMMNASTFSSLSTFHDILTRTSIDIVYPEINGDIIHRYFSSIFPISKQIGLLTLHNLTLQIHCRADGLWLDSNQNKTYILELKTIKNIKTISSKLEYWLLQIACYQLAYDQCHGVLLFILETGSIPYKSYVYEVSSDNISRAIRTTWTHWFRNHLNLLRRCVRYQKGESTLSELIRLPPPAMNTTKQPLEDVVVQESQGFYSLDNDDSDDEEVQEDKEKDDHDESILTSQRLHLLQLDDQKIPSQIESSTATDLSSHLFPIPPCNSVSNTSVNLLPSSTTAPPTPHEENIDDDDSSFQQVTRKKKNRKEIKSHQK